MASAMPFPFHLVRPRARSGQILLPILASHYLRPHTPVQTDYIFRLANVPRFLVLQARFQVRAPHGSEASQADALKPMTLREPVRKSRVFGGTHTRVSTIRSNIFARIVARYGRRAMYFSAQ